MSRPPLPPFPIESAIQKVRLAEDAWTGGDPACVSLAYSPDSRWCNRSTFLKGSAQIEHFVAQKWQGEFDDRLVKVDADGLMHTRVASIKHLPINETERLCAWPARRRPDEHAGLTALDL